MADYTLFCAPDTYAMSAHAVLEEIGADYDVHWINIFSDNPDPAFLAASPHCRTPALASPDGTVFETGAVALYLAERHPEANLVIEPGDARRGAFLQWFHYLASTLQPDVIIQYHPEFYHTEPDRQAALKAASMKRLAGVLDTLEAALENGPYFFGDQITVPDFILAMQSVWDVIFPNGDITAYPNIARHRDAVCARPSVQRMQEQHRAEAARRKS
ncbi:glutathione S-transferase family protein [Cochlodiniinecator piscidefendens]|uniref:glutathione S-transferase family protein n=1 Tax=Cochlodiniinecator piscidefendens TaxID=2715756 RepID=UPI0014090A22|nr:glutathione S-transferase family protein [Cochlodiniinecator piscidefendens]